MNGFEHVRKNIEEIRGKIDAINTNVKLLGVTKTFSVEAVDAAIQAGIVEFGESKVQEAADKIDAINRLHKGIKWHFIGHLQSNKVRKVVEKFDVIESCDSAGLIEKISSVSLEAGRTTECLLEIKVSGEETKFGIAPEEALSVINRVKDLGGIRIKGIMTMAPYSDDQENARPYFRRAKELFDAIQSSNPGGNVSMEVLSMGMSDDFRVAIEEGSTQVRIGTAIFGRRDYL
jgi:pyridoxal phosphate enzyme (YggS family)